MKVTARTRVFALLGDPVAHSLSPRMHNAAFAAAGVDAIYVVMQPSAEEVGTLMAMLARTGGGGNITVPFKEVAARVTGRRTATVELLASANVFSGASDELELGNTDVTGILAALDRLGAAGDAWHLLGTGGSARAVVGAAAERGACVAIRSRDPARARSFVDWAASIGVASATPDECSVVINATPVGMSAADPLPIDPATLPANCRVLDLVYSGLGPTAWVTACAARGLQAIDGREVLLAQGAASWPLWLPGATAPREVMRAALDGRLG
jgi:shikimate dehydrogenase